MSASYVDKLIDLFERRSEFVTDAYFKSDLAAFLANYGEIEYQCDEDHCTDYDHEDMISIALDEHDQENREEMINNLIRLLEKAR